MSAAGSNPLPTFEYFVETGHIVKSEIDHHIGMPLGDPHGGEFEYTDEGLPESVFACTIPVRDIGKSSRFYTDILGMSILGVKGGRAYLRRKDFRVILEESDRVGIDTGIYIGVGNPYDSRRRMIDLGIVFDNPPTRSPLGTVASIRDDDGNIIHLIEEQGEFRMD